MTRADKKWLKDLFEFENCEECGFDEKHHKVIMVLGNRFALCTPPEQTPEEKAMCDKADQMIANGRDVQITFGY